jgi:hypothetical protein
MTDELLRSEVPVDQRLHHDDLQTSASTELSGVQLLRLQANFLSALEASVSLLDELGVARSDYFITGGGAVFLREFGETGESSRGPTDLDIIVKDTPAIRRVGNEIPLERLGVSQFVSARVITFERNHHGFIFPNPVWELETQSGFSVDIIPGQMITKFPHDHWLLPGEEYRFPVDSSFIFDETTPIMIEGIGECRAGNMAFVSFYKFTMDRNTMGKQDRSDLRIMRDRGYIDTSDPQFTEFINYLLGEDLEKTQRFCAKLQETIA